MLDSLKDLSPILQALIATLFTWGVTMLGAASVLIFRSISRRMLDGVLGFAGGVMIAASFWSLLAPAIEMSAEFDHVPEWFPALTGFLAGGIVLRGIDLLLPHLHPGDEHHGREGVSTHWRRSLLLVLAITMHNFPEGLAVGVAFGAVAQDLEAATFGGAVALAIGIGLQNFPEGVAVAMPLRREGMSPWKSFFYGQASGIVEPIAGMLGAALVIIARPILPYALAFAAGAMIFVVAEEVIPSANSEGHGDTATAGVMLGFAIMMLLDVSLG